MSDLAIISTTLGALGAFITVVVGAIVLYLKTRQHGQRVTSNIQDRHDRSALGPLREALTISREDQIRLSSQVTRLSEVMDYLLEENASCFIENSNLYGWAQQSYRFNQRVAKQLGINLADELSPLPDRKERPKRPEFEARTAQQAAVLVQTSTVTGVVPANDTAAKPS